MVLKSPPPTPTVKEKEDLHPDVDSQGMNDDTFCEYRWAVLLLCKGKLRCKSVLREWNFFNLLEMYCVVEILI